MKLTIRAARVMAGLTQRQAADSLGITRDSYRKIELQPEKTPIEMAMRVSECFKVPYDDLIFLPTESTLSRVSGGDG